jgi:uncharacterized membrane protein YeaQ/YmgE (transglycosylase-associated protein family)
MGIISWLVLGLVVGLLAKFIMPGKDPGGLVLTIVLGIVGAFVGGFVGSLLKLGTVKAFDIRSLGLAVVGALIVLYAYRKLVK